MLLLGLLALSCTEYSAAVDQFGNRYPLQCLLDLSYVDVPVVFVSEQTMAKLAYGDPVVPRGHRLYGLTIRQRLILVDDSLKGWRRDDVIRHEKCHIIAGNWH
jgi:hypothetical protein